MEEAELQGDVTQKSDDEDGEEVEERLRRFVRRLRNFDADDRQSDRPCELDETEIEWLCRRTEILEPCSQHDPWLLR